MKVNFPNNQMSIMPKEIVSTQTDNNVGSFSEYLTNALSDVSKLQNQSEALSQALALGETDNLHQVMIASEKAEMALQFTIQIRNKLIDAYQEIMRMNV